MAKLELTQTSTTSEKVEENLNNLRINDQYFVDLAKKLKMEKNQSNPSRKVFIPKTGGKTRFLAVSAIED